MSEKMKSYAMLKKVCQEGLTATVVGWGCCCDINMAVTAGGWAGNGFSKKDKGLEINLELSTSNDEEVNLVVELRSDTDSFKVAVSALTVTKNSVLFSLDVDGFFGTSQATDGTVRNLMRILVSGHQSLKNLFQNYAFGLSYMPVVFDLFENNNHPARILEWGPGRSSILFAELFPDATITGVEHNPGWYKHCEKITESFPSFTAHFRNLKLSPAQSEGYVSFPLFQEEKYDLIFVDGRLRCDCVAIASLVLADDGVILLHDAHRKVYPPSFELFEEQATICNTAILKKPTKRLS